MNSKEEMKKYRTTFYNRKSQDADDKQALSIPAQIEEDNKMIERYGLTTFNFRNEAKSAKTPGLRKEFLLMIADIEEGRVNSIGCWKLDRLARNMLEAGIIIDLLQKGKILSIFTPSKVYLPSDNVLLMALEFGVANQFSRDLSINVKRGQEQKAKNGTPHGIASLGFLNDKTEEKGNRRWKIDTERLPLVKDILNQFLTGSWSAGKLSTYAKEVLKLTTPKRKKLGGAFVVRSRIYEILKDPIYAGFFFYGGNRYELDTNLPRLITEEQHNRILRMLASKGSPKIKNHATTYSGFIKSPFGEFIGQDIKAQLICDCSHKFSHANKINCPKCNKPIISLENPKYLEYTYYYNVSRKKTGLEWRSVSESQVKDFLIPYFKENLLLSDSMLEWSRKHIHELKDTEIEKHTATVALEKGKVEEAEKRKKKILELMADEQISGEDGKQMLKELNETISGKNQRNAKVDWFEKAMDITNLLEEFLSIMNSSNIHAKRSVLSRLGSNLIWDEEKVSISNTKAINTLIDGLRETRNINEQFEPKKLLLPQGQKELLDLRMTTMLRG